MISSPSVIKRLINLSVSISLLLSVLSITPMFLTLKHFPFGIYLYLFSVLLINMLCMWAINILLVYWFEKYNVLNNSNTLRYLVSFVVCVTFSVLFMLGLRYINPIDFTQFHESTHFHEKGTYAPFFGAIFTNTFILFIQEFVLLREKKSKIELENTQLKIEKAEAYNQQLKQHIHPHFLFNSLSILKSLIQEAPDVAEEYVVRLSDFLRVSISSISSTSSNVVKLQDELKICEDYLAMQKIRFGVGLQINFRIPDNVAASGYVPGFSLQLLLENAIKHNALTSETPLQISVYESSGWISVENNIQEKLSVKETTNSGLKNLSKRYQIISGQDIRIDRDDRIFRVTIKILSSEYYSNRG